MNAIPLNASLFRRLALTGTLSACAALAPAQVREFTSTDGRAIQAELVAAFGDSAVLRLNSADHEIPLSRLIEGDGEFVRAWAQENANGPTDLLAISFEEKMVGKEEQEAPNIKVATESWVYEISVASKLQSALESVELEYVTAYRDSHYGAEEEKVVTRKQVQPLARIAADGEPAQATTAAINVRSSREAGGKRRQDELIGVWVRLKSDGRIIAERKSEGPEMAAVEWPE